MSGGWSEESQVANVFKRQQKEFRLKQTTNYCSSCPMCLKGRQKGECDLENKKFDILLQLIRYLKICQHIANSLMKYSEILTILGKIF